MGDAEGFSTLRALWALRDDRGLDPATWKVAVALLMFTNQRGECFPSLARLADTARTSRSAIRRALDKLEAHRGPLRVQVQRSRRTEHGDADSNRYLLTLVEGCNQGDPTCDQPDPTCDHPSPGVGPAEPHGCDQADPTGVTRQTPEEDRRRGQGKKTVKQPRAARWRRCPTEWEPKEEHRQIALDEGVDFEKQLKLFRDHDFERAKSDADATFRNWLRSDFAKPRGGTKPSLVQGGTGEIRSAAPRWAGKAGRT